MSPFVKQSFWATTSQNSWSGWVGWGLVSLKFFPVAVYQITTALILVQAVC